MIETDCACCARPGRLRLDAEPPLVLHPDGSACELPPRDVVHPRRATGSHRAGTVAQQKLRGAEPRPRDVGQGGPPGLGAPRATENPGTGTPERLVEHAELRRAS